MEKLKNEIKDEELKNVSGGCNSKVEKQHNDTKYVTFLRCSDSWCTGSAFWRGDYIDNIAYICPSCGKKTLYGQKKEITNFPFFSV